MRSHTSGKRAAFACALATLLAFTACSGGTDADRDPARAASSGSTTTTTGTTTDTGNWRVEIVARRAHDTNTFTQGLEIDGAVLYESSGLYDRSTVRAIDRASGRVLRSYDLPDDMFAEGLTKVGDSLVVLTWQERVVLVLDAATLTEVGRLDYDAEGWGICALGDELVTSDGTDRLTIRDERTLSAKRTVDVRLAGAAVSKLNELECVEGAVYANVWQTDRIVRIDATTGTVTGHADVPQLRPASTASDPDAVLNGIAYDTASATFLLTGKRWPEMYEVRFVPAS